MTEDMCATLIVFHTVEMNAQFSRFFFSFFWETFASADKMREPEAGAVNVIIALIVVINKLQIIYPQFTDRLASIEYRIPDFFRTQSLTVQCENFAD